ncbi:adenylate/guanylate cyclase domain-containing protein [Marinomonas sp. 15G1-11]|uniref:Adenylate/guanylate cyclase domain-containing protein n=1 Tax=Marinomonas phaeophyticola TaxID=3004091 RepID=A0ABT4JSK6_9GAMM|nr:adenylate/guanylate cyclase domain-containing protein [Marinomonas sp. 15G1-11]MCZ2721344.1 adenylate/guanylate cyclase domain-containing protein [Marinomonas sp. 15G1-11]
MITKLAVIALAGLLTIFLSTFFNEWRYSTEEKFGALGWSLFPSSNTEERVTIVAIDEQSLSEIGPWPWPREVLAELSNKLGDAGAALQLYDIVLPESKTGDDALVSVLQQQNSILAQVPVLGNNNGIQTGLMSGEVAGMRCQPPLPNTSSYLANHATYASIPKGHITPIVDADGMIRKQPPLICVQGRVYPSLSLQALLQNLPTKSSEKPIQIIKGDGFFAPAWNIHFPSYFGIKVPLDKDGNVRISYSLRPDAFQVVSAADVLLDRAPSNLLDGAWTLIGATAFGLGDIVPTPHSGATPGVELQARLLTSLLDGDIPYSPANANLIWFFECLAITALLLGISSRRNRVSSIGLPLAALCIPVLALAMHMQLLQSNVWLGWFIPFTYALIAASFLALLEHGRVRVEKQRVFNNLSSYLPGQAAHNIAFNLPSGAVEAHRSELVLMCADLRNFSSYEESRPPEEAAALLHCFFVQASEIIEKNGGQVEEFKGDSVLSSWSCDKDNAATMALKAANELQDMISTVIPSRPPAGLEPMALGIAIEKGPTLVGSIGPSHRRSHTILGDTVTITLRIQEMTQELAQPILIGECAARSLSSKELESQGSYLLDGLRTPHILFAPKVIQAAELYEADLHDSLEITPFRVISGGKH